jgi:hypothetical protein
VVDLLTERDIQEPDAFTTLMPSSTDSWLRGKRASAGHVASSTRASPISPLHRVTDPLPGAPRVGVPDHDWRVGDRMQTRISSASSACDNRPHCEVASRVKRYGSQPTERVL